MRRTKILATIGPASETPEVLRKMIKAGLNAVRCNFSHGTADDHRKRVQMIRDIAKEMGVPIGILADLQGPKIRVAKFENGKVTLEKGAEFTLDAEMDSEKGNQLTVGIDYKELPNDDKFDLGGRSLRGFDSFGVGPRNSRTSYVGGKNIVVTNFDLHRPIIKNDNNPIDLNLFIDAGTVFDNKVVPTSSKETIRSTIGFGIKFYSPIGPIGFTWGFPISSEDYDIERMFTFSIGNLN